MFQKLVSISALVLFLNGSLFCQVQDEPFNEDPRYYRIPEAYYITESDTTDLSEMFNEESLYMLTYFINDSVKIFSINSSKIKDRTILLGKVRQVTWEELEESTAIAYAGDIASIFTESEGETLIIVDPIPGSVEEKGVQYIAVDFYFPDKSRFLYYCFRIE